MLDFLAQPYAPCAVLIAVAALGIGFYWGSRSSEDRIGVDLSSMGRFRIGDGVFEGRFIGYANEDDDEGGDPTTVEDLLNDKPRSNTNL